MLNSHFSPAHQRIAWWSMRKAQLVQASYPIKVAITDFLLIPVSLGHYIVKIYEIQPC